MTTISFNDLPEAVTELTRKVDELYKVITNVQPQDPAEQFLTVDETAKFLNLSIPTIYSKVSRRELPYMKRGKRLYFARKDLETYLQGGRVKTVREIEAEADQYLTSKTKKNMKTKKEHPAGDQVQDLITFFGHERLSVEDHFKDIDNFLLFKEIHEKTRKKLHSDFLFVYEHLTTNGCATVGMLISRFVYVGETRLRIYLRYLIEDGKLIESKKRYKCKASGTPAHYYMALPPAYWYENYLKP